MLLREIEGSSNVKAAGFEGGILRVLFHSGHFHDYPGRTQADFDALLAAPSKGRYVRERLWSAAPVPDHNNPRAPLDTMVDDECCGPRLQKALRNDMGGVLKWECPKCGCEWIAEPTEIGRHWRPVTWAVRL